MSYINIARPAAAAPARAQSSPEAKRARVIASARRRAGHGTGSAARAEARALARGSKAAKLSPETSARAARQPCATAWGGEPLATGLREWTSRHTSFEEGQSKAEIGFSSQPPRLPRTVDGLFQMLLRVGDFEFSTRFDKLS